MPVDLPAPPLQALSHPRLSRPPYGDRGAHTEYDTPIHDELDDACLPPHLDPIALLHLLDQRSRDLGACLISVRVDDSPS